MASQLPDSTHPLVQLFNRIATRRDLGKFAGAAALAAPFASLTKGVVSAQTPTAGGTLTYALPGAADTLFPEYSLGGYALDLLYSIFDTLTAVHPVTQEIEGVLAESWDISGDGLEYTFHLRQGVTFHDGTPFDADAVKLTYDLVIDPANPTATTAWIGPVTEITVVDPATVKFILSSPFSPLLGNLASGFFGIPSPVAVRERGDQFGVNPVGSGRFVFTEWVSGESVTLERNPGYVNYRSFAENKGAPYVDQFTIKIIPESGTQLAAFETGELTMVQPPLRDVSRLQADDNYEVHAAKTATVFRFIEFSMIAQPEGTFGAEWKAPFDDLRLRQAVAYAIDVDSIITNIYEGLATRAYGPMPTGLFAYKPEIEQFGYHYDPDKAKALIAEAGWTDTDSDGVLEKGDEKLEILYLGWDDPTFNKVHQVIQNQLQEAGFQVELQLMELGSLLAELPNNTSDLNFMGWGQTEPDLLRGVTNKGWGVGRYQDEECQGLLTRALETTDRAERTELYFEAQKKMLADVALIPLYNDLLVLATQANVGGFKYGQQDFPVYEDLYFEG